METQTPIENAAVELTEEPTAEAIDREDLKKLPPARLHCSIKSHILSMSQATMYPFTWPMTKGIF